MLRNIGQDALGNIAEYVDVGRVDDINSIGILDSTLVMKIRQYNKDFSYVSWRKDLEDKDVYSNLIDTYEKYKNRIGEIQRDIEKPDEIANILSTPNTLEEYLIRLIRYNNNPYRMYYETLVGNWKIHTLPDGSIVIYTDDYMRLYDMLNITSKTISYNQGAITLKPIDEEELTNLMRGIMYVIDIVYPIRE